MFGGEVVSIRLLQGVGCTLKPADGLYMRCELNQISLVQFVKACGIRTVDIQNADDAPLMAKRDDDLASGCAVAGDMAGKGVHVPDHLRACRIRRAPAESLCRRAGRRRDRVSACRRPADKSRTS